MLQISRDYLDDLMVRMAHHSTAIEGNSLTQGETKSMLIDNYLPRAMDYKMQNYSVCKWFMAAKKYIFKYKQISFLKSNNLSKIKVVYMSYISYNVIEVI